MDYKIIAGDLIERKNLFMDCREIRRVVSVLKIETTLKVDEGKSYYVLELEPKEVGQMAEYIYSGEVTAHYKKVEEPILKTNCGVTTKEAQQGVSKATDIFKEVRSTPIAYL